MLDTVWDWRIKLSQGLATASESPALDAQVLLAHVMGRNRSWVLAHPEAVLLESEIHNLENASQALLKGNPLPYVLGHWEFFGLDFLVTPDVLIPRPETELLVEQALAWMSACPAPCTALEVGVGSGCIAVSLAVCHPQVKITGVDISEQALSIAHKNAQKHAVASRIDFVLSDMFEAISGQFDLICANLPYIPTLSLQGLPVARHEPRLALDGGPDGLDRIRRFLEQAPGYLAKKSLILAEIEANQGPAVMSLALNIYPAAQVNLLQDLAGKDRLLRIEQE